MRKKILAALLLFVSDGSTRLHGWNANLYGSGLTAGRAYRYGYEDSNGNVITGTFEATSPTYNIPGVDASIDCGSVGVVGVEVQMIAEGPIV